MSDFDEYIRQGEPDKKERGIYKFAEKIRDYNITKSEWVLDGETVIYASADNIRATLEYDFEQEKSFNYKGLSQQQIIEHIAHFISDLWQVHIFGEGNTRTTAVFLIKYLRKLGFEDINNDLFAEHSWYFRNALVRANYKNLKNNIHTTSQYLERFLENLLLGENNELRNRELHIHFKATENVTSFSNKNVTDRILKIITLIRENNHISTTKMAAILSVSKRTILRDINKLKQSGKISREGDKKTGAWKILNNE